MEPAAEEFGLRVDRDVDERYHVEKATRAACAYLNEAHRRYGDWILAAASYNMGMSGLSRRLDQQQGESYWDLMLNDETARYIYRLYATKQVMEAPEAHGFMLAADDWYSPVPGRDTILLDSVDDLAAFARQAGVSYNALKTLNPVAAVGQIAHSPRSVLRRSAAVAVKPERHLADVAHRGPIEGKLRGHGASGSGREGVLHGFDPAEGNASGNGPVHEGVRILLRKGRGQLPGERQSVRHAIRVGVEPIVFGQVVQAEEVAQRLELSVVADGRHNPSATTTLKSSP